MASIAVYNLFTFCNWRTIFDGFREFLTDLSLIVWYWLIIIISKSRMRRRILSVMSSFVCDVVISDVSSTLSFEGSSALLKMTYFVTLICFACRQFCNCHVTDGRS
jgi:hypothetical protein